MKDRFLKHVSRDSDGCWRWTARIDRDGYGRFRTPTKRSDAAHRVAYTLFVGPIPEGHEIDHTCHGEDSACRGGRSCLHRSCVNPDHLEAVTHRENDLRGRSFAAVNARKTHCIHGHEFNETNTYLWRGVRFCRTCVARRGAASRKRRAARRNGEA